MQEAMDEDEVVLLDLILELAHFFGVSEEDILDWPVQRFWSRVEWLGKRRKREAKAGGRDPLTRAHQQDELRESE